MCSFSFDNLHHLTAVESFRIVGLLVPTGEETFNPYMFCVKVLRVGLLC